MRKPIGLFILTTFIAQAAHADTLRCGNKLIYTGDTTYTVRTRCGQPDDALHRTEVRTVTHEISEPCATPAQHTRCSRSVETSIEVIIDEWTYDFGADRFIQYLRFENGRLLSIKEGDYGKK